MHIQGGTSEMQGKGEADFVRQAFFIALQSKSEALAIEFDRLCSKEIQSFSVGKAKACLLIQALGDMAYPSSFNTLYHSLLSDNPRIVETAVAALKKFGPTAGPGPQTLASEGPRKEKKAYAKALKDLGLV